jgi:hypothetical protein
MRYGNKTKNKKMPRKRRMSVAHPPDRFGAFPDRHCQDVFESSGDLKKDAVDLRKELTALLHKKPRVGFSESGNVISKSTRLNQSKTPQSCQMQAIAKSGNEAGKGLKPAGTLDIPQTWSVTIGHLKAILNIMAFVLKKKGGDLEKTKTWLDTPTTEFGGVSPIEYMLTELPSNNCTKQIQKVANAGSPKKKTPQRWKFLAWKNRK